MRTLLAVASLVMLVGAGFGCGDDTTSGGVDMTVGPDMHVATDMAKMNCKMLLACAGACTSQTCVATCAAASSSTAVQKATVLAACINGKCGTVDGGTGACTSPGDTSAGCQSCEQGAVLGTCSSQYSACQADM